MPHRLTSGKGLVGAIGIGRGGSALTFVKRFAAVSVDPGSIASVSRGTGTAACSGAVSGDFVLVVPPSTLHDDLVFCGAYVSAPGVVTIALYNPTGGAIDDTARNWDVLLLRAV